MKHQIKKGMEVVGFDGAHVGVVDRIDGDRIKLEKSNGGHAAHQGHHHYIGLDSVERVEGHKVRLWCNADAAVVYEQEKSGRPVKS